MRKFTILLAIILLGGLQVAFAQTKVTGTVTDADDKATIPGVTVLVKGTTVGTTTGLDGKFELLVPADGKILVFSFVGMISQEIEIGGRTVINVSMTTSSTALDEVVVTALGISREKKSLGYAVQEISGDAVSEVRETNFVNSLSGKVSGVHIRQSNTLGGSANILIRGTTSLTQNNQALFVVDGVPINNNNTNEDRPVANGSSNQNDGWGGYDYGNAAMDINPDDIESISVLKGAAATALYGSRAANGVILITTKKGKRGKGIGITVSTGLTLSQADMNTAPKHQTKYGGGYGPFYEDPTGNFYYADLDGDGVEDLIAPTSEDASWGAPFDPNTMVIHWDALDPSKPNYAEKRPWMAPEHGLEYFFQTGLKWTTSIAFDGGNDDGSFRLSYTNSDETGIVPNSSIDKNSINLNANYNFSDKLSVDANITYSHSKAKGRYGTGYDGMNVMQSFGQWFQTNVDFKRLEDNYLRADGSQLSWNSSYYNDLHPIYFDNPYWVRNKSYEDDYRDRIFGFTGLNYELTDWLTFTGRVSLDYYTEVQNERIAVGSVDPSYFSSFTRSFNEMNTDLYLKFNKRYDDFSFNGMIGTNFRQNTISMNLGHTVGGLIVPDLYAISNSISPVSVTEDLIKTGTNSVFGTFSVGYKDFVYLELSDRYDVSSTLPLDNNSFNYYSASLSLLISELGGLKDLSFLDFAKVRANYAEVGNDAPAYSTISTYSQGTNWNDYALFSVNSILQNAKLEPERTKSIELGLEARFFDSRVNFDIAVYKSNTINQIMPALVSPSTGYSQMFVNGGEIENKGLEISLLTTPVKYSDFEWNIGVNWYANRNKVISLYEDVDNLLIYSAWDVSINATVGEPYGTIKGTNFVYTNENGDTEDADGNPLTEENGSKTVDENGYYLMSESGEEVIGNINPDWNMGISSAMTYKGIRLNVLFDFQHGGDVYSVNTKYGQATGVYAETAENNDKGNPMRDAVDDGGGYLYPETVNIDGSPNTTYVPAYRWGRAFYYNNSPTARYVFDASYVKLREVSLAYTLPGKIVEKTPFQNITFSVVGRNLAILFKNTEHFDPESGLGSGNNQGIETGAYPTARTFGFNIKFGI
ncbi:MAG: SusC/RagA family TonB-linked outer membrane protein [Bacteroidales bacterium]|nr:SusC/RagA family TonB-linked outer membrane protein [Bacteroidales bacterium]